MALAVSMFRWLDLLEKEFDQGFVELDVLLGDINDNQHHQNAKSQQHTCMSGRQKLTMMSSSFAQLVHKSQTIFQTNAKLEAELIALRSELTEAQAKVKVFEKELKKTLLQLHAVQLQLHMGREDSGDSNVIMNKLESELMQYRQDAVKEARLDCEVKQYAKENEQLRKHVLSLQGEVNGARLAAKYLDKELAGRIQQIQLLARNLKVHKNDTLWKHIEAEIHLHRHKTVIRACRARTLPATPSESGAEKLAKPLEMEHTEENGGVRRRRGIGDVRVVHLHREKTEGLGISITGGIEHGVPIIISEIHEGMPAERSQSLFVGDALLTVNDTDLKDVTHTEAVHALSRVHGEVRLEVLYIDVDDDESEVENWEEDSNSRYSTVGVLDDPSELTLNTTQVYMTNTPSDAKVHIPDTNEVVPGSDTPTHSETSNNAPSRAETPNTTPLPGNDTGILAKIQASIWWAMEDVPGSDTPTHSQTPNNTPSQPETLKKLPTPVPGTVNQPEAVKTTPVKTNSNMSECIEKIQASLSSPSRRYPGKTRRVFGDGDFLEAFGSMGTIKR